ncbi:MAG: protein kinase [Pirellulaceae bacterium]
MKRLQPSHDELEDAEFQQLLISCLEALERGESIDRGELLRRNPRYASLIDEFLGDRESLERLAGELRDSLSRPAKPSDGLVDETLDSSPKVNGFALGESIRYIGEFEILEEIARGGMGVVFKARQQRLKRIVALKMILSGRLADDADVARFQREAQAAANLKHPGIVAVHEVGQHDGHHYFTMDFVEGRSLAEELREESLSPRRAAEVVQKAAEAIDYAHDQGTLHRDLKPANVLLDESGEPRITDFGLAKVMHSGEQTRSELTATGQILGTPSYMSPEQASGQHDFVGPGSDVYSLGAILYACLTGRAPFVAESPVDTLMQVIRNEPVSPRTLNPQTPVDLETICLKCLAKEPAKRYATAKALADDLQRFLEGRPVVARPVGPMAKSWRWCRRNPVVAALLCLIAFTMICGTAVSSFFAIEESYRAAAEALAKQDALDARQAEARQRAEAVRLAGVANNKQMQAEAAERRADERRQEAEESRELAERRAQDLRRQLYVANMSQAQLAWEDDNITRMLDLLEAHRPAVEEQDLRGFEWHYLWRLAHSARLSIDTGNHAFDMACSPDGKLVATVNNRQVELWDTATGERVAAFEADAGAWGNIAFSPDGGRLAYGRDTIKIWEVAKGRLVHELEGPESHITTLAFHPDGKRLAIGAGGRDAAGRAVGEVWILNPSFEQVDVRISVPSIVQKVAWHPGGSRLAGADSDSQIHYWDAATGAELTSWKGSLYTQALAFSPDGKRLAHGGNYRYVEILDTTSGKRLAAWRNLDGEVKSLAFHSDGDHLIGGDTSGKVYVWSTTSNELEQFFRGHASAAVAATFRPGFREVVSLEDHGVIKFWDLDAEQGQIKLQDSVLILADVAFSPRGDWLACAEGVRWNTERQCAVRMWRADTGQPGPRLVGHARNVFGVAFRGDGAQLASAGDDGKVILWDVATAEPLRTFEGYGAAFRSVAFAPGGERLAAGAEDGSVLVWDAATGERLHLLTLHGRPVESLSWSSDGTLLAACDSPGLKVWRMPEADEVVSIAQDRTRAVAFSPNVSMLACGVGRDVQLYDVASWKRSAAMNAHADEIYGLAFSPEGERLATSSRTGTIKLWDVKTHQSTMVLAGATSDPNHATPRPAFSADGTRIVAGRRDEALVLWTTEPHLRPASVDSKYWKSQGARYARLQRWPEALECFEKVLVARHDDGWTLLDAVECAYATGDATVYHKYAQAALDFVQRHADDGGVMLLGRLCRAACLGPSPAEEFSTLRKHARDTWEHHGAFHEGVALLFVLYRAGDDEALLQATEELAPAATRNPSRPVNLLFRSIALYRLGRISEASEVFTTAADELDASLPSIGAGRDIDNEHFNWVVWCQAIFREAAPLALEKLDAALMDEPDNVDLLVHRGLLHRRWQRWDKAFVDFQRAVSLAPEEFDYREYAATMALLAGKLMIYQQQCEKMEALVAQPEHAEHAWRVGRVASLMPDAFDDGETLLERVQEIARRYPSHWPRTQAVPAVLYRLGRYDEAARAVELPKSRAGVWQDRAATLLWEAMIQHQRGETQLARETFDASEALIEANLQPPGLAVRGAITPVEVIVLWKEAAGLLGIAEAPTGYEAAKLPKGHPLGDVMKDVEPSDSKPAAQSETAIPSSR